MEQPYVKQLRTRVDRRQEWIFVDEWVCDQMMELGYNVGFTNRDPYPHPVMDDRQRLPLSLRLHVFVWGLAVEAGLRTPAPSGFHIHHRNGRKADNRLSNLVVLSDKEHARVHGRERKQAGERRRVRTRLATGGWWRDQPPGPVKSMVEIDS